MGFRFRYQLLVCGLLLAGCDLGFDEVHEVNQLRVLAVSAEPPEIKPGEGTSVSVLWADPKGGGRTVELVWWLCAGYAHGANLEMCEMLMSPFRTSSDEGGDHFDIPETPADIFETAELPEGWDTLMVTVVGLLCAGGTLPSDEALATPTHVDHIDQYCERGEAVSFWRIIEVSESESPNLNPGIDRVMHQGEPLVPMDETSEGRTVRCKKKEGCDINVVLKLFMTEGSEQSYEIVEYGETKTEKEVLFVSWFTTNGNFDDGSRYLVNDDAPTPYGPFEIGWEPDEPGNHVVYAVAHDTRGGVSFEAYEFEVLPAP
jgi:hypothetical protein